MEAAEIPSAEPGGRDTMPIAAGDGTSEAASFASGVVLGGKYLIEEEIGAGGVGVVLGALHLSLRERVAIKVLRPDLARNAEAVARFLREAQALARLKGEHVARVMDVAALESGTPYLVMEYLTGKDLARVLAEGGPLSVTEAALYVGHACEAMIEAHALGIIHRDLKPANLVVTSGRDGAPRVKVIDFGIAKALDAGLAAGDEKLTARAVLLGSPAYMSPEQVRAAASVDERSDVWSLGVILYELCTGRAPFEADTPAALLAAIVADPPVPLRARRPDAPPALEAIVNACLAKDRGARMASARELAGALAELRLRADVGGSGESGTAEPRARWRVVIAGGVAVAGVALLLAGTLARSGGTARPWSDSVAPGTASVAVAMLATASGGNGASLEAATLSVVAEPTKRAASSRPQKQVASAKSDGAKSDGAKSDGAVSAAPALSVESVGTAVSAAPVAPQAASVSIPPGGDVEEAMARRK